MNKLKMLKNKLKAWNKEIFKLAHTKKQAVVEEISRLDLDKAENNWSSEKAVARKNLKEFKNLNLIEHRIAHQKNQKLSGFTKEMQTPTSFTGS